LPAGPAGRALDEIADLHAADCGLVALDAENQVAALAVGERRDGLEDLPLGLDAIFGKLLLELDRRAFPGC
jgi:hypothetical protein